MILGMDSWVFTAWIGTILGAIVCLMYGIYHEFVKKPKKKSPEQKKDMGKKEKT
jgi:hypothetical protein